MAESRCRNDNRRVKHPVLLLYMRMLKGFKSENMVGKICYISFVFFLSKTRFTKFSRTHTIKQITNQKCKNIAIFTTHVLTFESLEHAHRAVARNA